MTNAPGEFAKALQTKLRKRRRARWVILGSGLLVALLVGIATWLVWFSSVLAATEVRINGVSLLTEQQVTDAAAVELGGPLATQDVDAIRARVAALAPVAEVRVERRFPHTIEITVTERTLAYVWMDEGVARWVDADGVVFHEGGETAQGIVTASITAPDQRLLKDVATVVSAVVPVLGERVALLQASAVDRIEIQLSDGDTVVWGSAEQSQVKARVLSVLLSQEASVYDVSAPHAPTTR
ncbi:cell division protein FtsQ/DivIB [[Pseudopropionibacterium] massiliense]|uniref:cell division protein FtsQ/DivIB n=1 Tax=[Pseudopropionibacterium] massiliense TaxID=2220000 RepID=UPI0010308C2D|nr:FtsQ-type POTRA domain-containing protein [[Pseudopropionibacterium] massiliense]